MKIKAVTPIGGGMDAARADQLWIDSLQIGHWLHLMAHGQWRTSQLAWISEDGEFYLFVAQARHSFLLQQGRVAVYLQAGLLRPQAVEGLTARATRDALEKLDANPERLLA